MQSEKESLSNIINDKKDDKDAPKQETDSKGKQQKIEEEAKQKEDANKIFEEFLNFINTLITDGKYFTIFNIKADSDVNIFKKNFTKLTSFIKLGARGKSNECKELKNKIMPILGNIKAPIMYRLNSQFCYWKN